MKPVVRPRSRACLLALALGFGCAPSLSAQTVPFAGRWLLDAAPSASAASDAYTVLTVEGSSLAWRAAKKTPPGCVQEFALRQEKPGTVYLDGRGKQFVAGVPGSIPTYLLQLVAGNCRGIEDALRISYPLIYDVDHIEIIEYVKGRPVSSRRFHRKPGRVKPAAPARPDSTGDHRDPRNPDRP